MQIDLTQFTGKCECGREHTLATKYVLIESGAIEKLANVLDQEALQGGCVICDDNTFAYAQAVIKNTTEYMHASTQFIKLSSELRADNQAVDAVRKDLPDDVGFLIAVGTGTIHDITRFVAYKQGIAFISVPTAATVDGFASPVCAMVWNGVHKNLPGVAPLAVLADSDIFTAAPYRLTAAGIGDALGKFTSLLDWKCGSILIDEDFCGIIFTLMKTAVETVVKDLHGIWAGVVEAQERLMYTLLLCGLCMQLWGDSRPACGSEHHLTYLWQMQVMNEDLHALHGEIVGVGMLVGLRMYEKLLKIGDVSPYILPYNGMPLAAMRKRFGALYDDILRINQPDFMRTLSAQRLDNCFTKLQETIYAFPHCHTLRPAMRAVSLKTTVDDLGLPREALPESALLSPYLSRRLTLTRVMQILKI